MASLKGLSNQFFTSLPESLGIVLIQRVPANSFADRTDRRVVRYDLADVAILAITPADLVRLSNYTSPNRSCRSLRDRPALEGSFALCRNLLTDLIDHCLYAARLHITAQLGLYNSWMHGRGAHALCVMTPVKSNREQNVRRLRSPVGNEWIIRRPLEVR